MWTVRQKVARKCKLTLNENVNKTEAPHKRRRITKNVDENVKIQRRRKRKKNSQRFPDRLRLSS